ncbi:hypothetical protein IHQ68_02830 [Chelatococcus sambhunathii]|uniref:Putative Flp pilus-assembly TadG-like N-terminal domain-containing protein n=1 Tax=Chelatococcus sambhunathii TaxID=363953 RepID=A0ABU1DBS6_9HYPH|nr:pilus assembly protein TadG-related protein [Chelatococcus sambhunathii]MDR4305557.1 hypothetical protein [Chelatococcus sambhunathii]
MNGSVSWLRPLGRRALSDQRGAVALLLGLLLLPLIGALGLAIDFGNIMTVRTKAQMAADAAALQATGVARDLIKSGDGSVTASNAAIADAKTRAKALFDAHARQLGIKDYTVTVTVTRTGQDLSATADFAVRSPNFLSKYFGFSAFRAVGAATSNASLPIYSDVYLALDISQSMGIASTQAGMNTLYNARARKTDGTTAATKCVFGCHTVEGGMAESNSTVAKRYGVQLRIDVLREAVKEMITTASEDSNSAPIYRLALYTMGMNTAYTNSKLIELSAPSDNFTTLSTIANTIDLGPAPGNGSSDSYINENLKDFAKVVPKSEDGASQDKSKKYAFIITDGVRDIQSSSQCVKSGNRCVSEVSSTSCEDMKKNGVTVGVLYTTYAPINPINPDDKDWYQIQVVNTGVAAKIQPALKACASDGWFYEASDAAGIQAAMTKMFAQTTSAPSLVN